MSFNLDTINYKTTKEHLKVKKIDNITIQIKELLIFNY